MIVKRPPKNVYWRLFQYLRPHWPQALLAYGAMFTWRDLGVVVAVVVGKLLGLGTDNVAVVFGVFRAVFMACGAVALALNRYAEERL